MPGMLAGSEWDLYYDDLADAFGLTIERGRPPLRQRGICSTRSPTPRTSRPSPASTRGTSGPTATTCAAYPIRDPTPVYPMSLIWRGDNPHPALAKLRDHLGSRRADPPGIDIWKPEWAR